MDPSEGCHNDKTDTCLNKASINTNTKKRKIEIRLRFLVKSSWTSFLFIFGFKSVINTTKTMMMDKILLKLGVLISVAKQAPINAPKVAEMLIQYEKGNTEMPLLLKPLTAKIF